MSENKCIKCGTNLPEGASFCYNCGAPKQVEQPASQPPAPQPVYQPMPKKEPITLRDISDQVFSKLFIMLGVCIGVLIAWIGKILTTFTSGVASQVGTVLVYTGLTGIGFMLLGGGLLDKQIDKHLKLGMIVAGGLIIVLGLP